MITVLIPYCDQDSVLSAQVSPLTAQSALPAAWSATGYTGSSTAIRLDGSAWREVTGNYSLIEDFSVEVLTGRNSFGLNYQGRLSQIPELRPETFLVDGQKTSQSQYEESIANRKC